MLSVSSPLTGYLVDILVELPTENAAAIWQLFKAQCVMSREGERFGNQINDVAQLLEKDSDVFTSVVTELPCLCI